MSYTDKIKAAFKPAKPGTPSLDQILEPMNQAEIDTRRLAAKQRMDAAVVEHRPRTQKAAA